MIRAFLMILLLAGPVMAQAPVTVLAGEHDGFTRLSVLIGSSPWQIGRTAEGYGLRLPQNRSFAVDRVFDVITQKRIAGLSQGERTLDITLGCQCHLRSFRHQGQWLVIDIRDGAPDPASPYEKPLFSEVIPLPIVMQRQPDMLPPHMTHPALPDAELMAYENRLQADLVDAAGLGNVDLVAPVMTEPAVVPPPPPSTDVVQQTLPVTLHHPHWAEGEALRAALPSTICPPDSAFDLTAWAGNDYVSATTEAYGALSLATGDAREAERDLARALIAYGFGLEASRILQTHDLTGADAYLRPLAQLVDGATDPAVFLMQEGCVGAVSLWRALAAEDIRQFSAAEIGAVIESYRVLPPDVRGQLAEQLAAIFAGSGDETAVTQIMAIAAGDTPPAPATRPSVEMLLADLTARLENRAVVTDDDLRLVQSLRYEQRGTPHHQPISEVEVQVLSALGAHRQALELARILSEDRRDDALVAAIASMTGLATPEAFLALAVDLPADLPDPALHLVAERLIDDGFPDRALALLAPAASGEHMAERRYLRAEAAAAMGSATVVEAELLGLSDPRAEAARAAALATTPDATSYAWRRADLPALEQSEDPLLQQAAQSVAAAPPPLPPTPLASREALIAQARDARALANALLSRFAAPP